MRALLPVAMSALLATGCTAYLKAQNRMAGPRGEAGQIAMGGVAPVAASLERVGRHAADAVVLTACVAVYWGSKIRPAARSRASSLPSIATDGVCTPPVLGSSS